MIPPAWARRWARGVWPWRILLRCLPENMVRLREAPLGIVYATDAGASGEVRVVATFPASSHPPIRYPLAILAASKNRDAAAFRAYLLSAEGQGIFAGYGFTKPE